MTDAVAAEEIRSLVARLAHLADGGDLDDYLALFTDDAVWDMPAHSLSRAPAGRRQGRAEIAEAARTRRAAGTVGPGSATRHVTGCVDVQVEDADNARAVAIWQFYAQTATRPTLVSMGRYDDRFRREGGRWLLASREITVG
ncbi:nuclear transport factor 2 family protein [Rhodococcus sp. X156]|uniref:nuclear transport factor 2 family protein n=1 Tax=Rhodococcus sp. X156 TaxID=2499145 RepID=UPI000FD9CF81|nr:nuclear transport factor 2 family protein [Rhodococcus sp. X156]